MQERGLQPGTGGCRGCGVDLVPVRVSPIFNCGKSANGQHLIVPIANLGSTPAPASILHVEFNGDGGYGVRDVNVPPINPFSLTRVAVNFPTGCPPCRFDIRVDANGAVTETGGPAPQWAESNNVANGQYTSRQSRPTTARGGSSELPPVINRRESDRPTTKKEGML